MIRERDLFLGQTVDARRNLLRLRAVVDEHQRRIGCTDVSQNEWRDRGPDAAADVSKIGDRGFDRDLHLLRHAAIDDRNRTECRCSRGTRFAATEESRDFLEWPLRCGQADTLWRALHP